MKKQGAELLGKNLVSLIIAVMGIIIIIIVIGIVLRTYWQNASLEKAASIVDYIIREIQEIHVGESKIITLPSSLGWFLVCFPENENFEKGFEKPSSMFGKKVLCACKNKRCETKACKEVDLLLKKDGELFFMKIEIINLNVTKTSDHYEIQVLEIEKEQ